jgi:hypothetical protein
MKPNYREELNELEQRENEKQVDADFQDFVKIWLPSLMGIMVLLIFITTIIITQIV